jgi:hypothetical protein
VVILHAHFPFSEIDYNAPRYQATGVLDKA